MLSRAASAASAVAAAAAAVSGAGRGARILPVVSAVRAPAAVPSARSFASSSAANRAPKADAAAAAGDVDSAKPQSDDTTTSSKAGSETELTPGASDADPAEVGVSLASANGTSPSSSSSAAAPTQSLRRGVTLAAQGQEHFDAANAAAAAAAAAAFSGAQPSQTASTGATPSAQSAVPPSSGPSTRPTPATTRPVAQPYQHRRPADKTPAPTGPSGTGSASSDAAPSPSGASSASGSNPVITGTLLSASEASRTTSRDANAGASTSGSSSGVEDSSGSTNLPSAALELTTAPTAEEGETHAQQHRKKVRHPFNTFNFVHRLRLAGFIHALPPVREGGAKSKGKERAEEGQDGIVLEGSERDTSADVVMDLTRRLLVRRSEWVLENHLNKSDLENEAYLFSAALAELRTETQVRARNDGAALRSMTTLLQREVDALDLKMREDIAMLKHDIQIEMNTRKAELKEGQNSLEQEIQDLHNRFTISLSDLKTEIEQNIKWDATRRSLALVFGIAAIVMTTLTLADILTREEQAAAAVGKAKLAGGSSSPSSSSGGSGRTSVAEDEAARAAREAGMNLRERPGEDGEGGDGGIGSGGGSDESDLLSATQSAEELGLLPRYDLDALRVI